MNLKQMTDNQVALILHGLRAIYVQGVEKDHAKLTESCERELGRRGLSLVD